MRIHRAQLLVSLLFFCVVTLPSCISRWQMQASLDITRDGETGPSGEKAVWAPTWNLLNEWLDDELGWMYDSRQWDDGPPGPWYPERYFAARNAGSGFGLVTDAGFVEKGRKFGSSTEHLDYLEASEAFAYVNRSASGVFYAGLGPYIGYGVGGKVKFDGGSAAVFGSDGYKRFDAGLHFLGAYRFGNGVSVGLGYDWGLFDKSNDPSDYTSRNRTWSVDVGYSVDKIVKAIRGK